MTRLDHDVQSRRRSLGVLAPCMLSALLACSSEQNTPLSEGSIGATDVAH